MGVISLRGIGKKYRIFPSRQDHLKEILSFGRIKRSHEFWALEDVNLDVEPGATLGILGRNGAGKTTLLRIISGVVQPTTGTVEVNGRLAALFGVGAGFNPEFTGRDNVMLNGLLLGIERTEMLERFDEIEAFADIGEFMDQPVKTYSSGMHARLGFAVAVNVDPDILVIDETLSVGDAVFKQMGFEKMRELRDSGTTILFVSHSLGMVRSFCNEAVLLHKGKIISSGDIGETLDRYEALVSDIRAQKNVRPTDSDRRLEYEIEREDEESADGSRTPLSSGEDPTVAGRGSRSRRRSAGEARVLKVELLDESGTPAEKVALGSAVTVRVYVEYLEDVHRSAVGIVCRNENGVVVFSTDTNLEKVRIDKRRKGERIVVHFSLKVPLQPGTYGITAAVTHPQVRKAHIDRVNAVAFEIERSRERRAVRGLVHIPTTIEIHDLDQERQNRPT
jgi:ABC-2 type transport system ATP-binding protein